MLRINSDNVLVVPPFEAAWLTDERLQLQRGNGCVEFEVRGQNDAAVIFKSSPGGRRWQHAESLLEAQQLNYGRNYTMIVGSHRNSCFKIERNGQQMLQVKDEPCTTLAARQFQRYWIEFRDGMITAGYGPPGANVWCQWRDPTPLPGLKFVGLGAWDSYNSFRNIAVHTSASAAGTVDTEALNKPASDPADPVPSLAQQCCDAINAVLCPGSVCTCLLATHALAPAVDQLQEQLLTHLAQHLPAVAEADACGFAALPGGIITQLLLCPSLVCEEKRIFDAVMVWYEDDPAAKAASMPDILPLIRFPLMGSEELQAVAEHPLASCHPVVCDLVSEALEFNRAPCAEDAAAEDPEASLSLDSKRGVRESQTASPASPQPAKLRRRRRRDLGGAHELMYLFDGDQEGVCYHFGTNWGASQWVNPVLTGRLQVRASSPLCRFTDAKALVGRQLVRSNTAGPQQVPAGAKGAKGPASGASWWSLDLGPRHRLACNYYTLRHDASNAFLRSWVLQGCEDADHAHWIDLRRHEHDLSIGRHGQYASWPVLGHAATVPCRVFRILLTDSNANPLPRRDTVCLSGFEFYGYLHDVKQDEPGVQVP